MQQWAEGRFIVGTEPTGGAPPPPVPAAHTQHASHCFVAVPPTPGKLWIFPGSVPHCVLGCDEGGAIDGEPATGAARDGASASVEGMAHAMAGLGMPDAAAATVGLGNDEPAWDDDVEARISIAINFTDATAPPPR